ncbi:hypothetical protein [Actinoplanes sp. N902-109]|uniref:hypothetical protein n=1 Tax=Actinoplanes sp. (strain N902-109) TaxID=649831 RepID=UPI0012F87901|nr:hypothetical protein [Actinoplanes sp. N902-109]
MNRRVAAVLVPLLALGLGACTDDPDPKTALAGSTAGIKAGNYTFSVTLPDGTTGKGVVHTPAASIDLTSTSFLLAGADRYVKLTTDPGEANKQLQSLQQLGTGDPKLVDGLQSTVDMLSGKTWMKLDPAKVTAARYTFPADNADVVGVTALLGAATTAKGGDTITGTLTAATKGLFAPVTGSVPYAATLDDKGRLTKLVLDGKWTAEFSGYGAAATPAAPPADQAAEAPDQAYAALNGQETP